LRRLAGVLARAPLRLVPPRLVVPVIAGPMRGLWWIAGSAPHGAWLGRLESAVLADFVRRVPKGACVWDVGANVGLYTLAAARAAGAGGLVVAFEPMARNVSLLRRHVALNGLKHVMVVAAAVSNVNGTTNMREGPSPSEFHLDPTGPIQVESISLDTWHQQSGARSPDVVKIDVEGAEALVLEGAHRLIGTSRPIIYLSVHTNEQAERCRQILCEAGYRLTNVRHERWPFAASEWIALP
jgi:FkbM family methyltransferase